MAGQLDGRHAFLPAAVAGTGERKLAAVVVLVFLLVLALCTPFARVKLPEIWAFVAVYEVVVAFSAGVTAIVLFMHTAWQRSRALLILACGYLFSALMMIPQALTFPGLLAPQGLLGAGPQSSAWLSLLWHGGFPIAVAIYARVKTNENRHARTPSARTISFAISFGVVGVVALAGGLAALAISGHDLLPAVMQDQGYAPAMPFAAMAVTLLSFTALLLLRIGRAHSALDRWMMIIMAAWLCDVALSALLNSGHFDLGFYVGHLFGLFAAILVPVLLLRATMLFHEQVSAQLESERLAQRRIADTLRDALAYQHAMFTSAPIGILTLDDSGGIERLNPAAERMFGLSGDLRRRHVTDLIDCGDETKQSAAARLARLLSACSSPRAFQAFAPSGAMFPVALALVEMPLGPRRMFVAFVEDLSKHERREREQREFIATVSHELRNPLTAIAGSLSLLADGAIGSLPPAALRLIRNAQANSQRLIRLTSDILDIARMESGKMPFRLRPVALRPLISGIVETSHGLAQRPDVTVVLDPPCDDASVQADPDRLTQALVNLIANAMKFSPAAGSVAVSIARGPSHVRVAVRDHGPGIEDSFKPRMFEKFAQGEGAGRRENGGAGPGFKGAGLGLSIVKEIVNRLGGEVGCSNAPDGGAIFFIDLPCADQTAAPQNGARGPARLANDEAPHDGKEVA